MNPVLKKLLRGAGVLLFWLLLWELGALIVGKAVILPSPFSVIKRLGELLREKAFYLACLSSVLRIFTGLLLGIIAGVLLAVLTKLSRALDVLFSPAVEVVKATPVASVIIVMLFVFTKNIVPMLAALLMVIPIIFMNVRRGINAAPTEKAEVAKIYGFGARKKLKLLYFPAVSPYFFAGCRSALGLSWKAGIAAEVICTPQNSIGTMLYASKIYLESDDLFALTVVIVLLSVIIEKLLLLAFGKASSGGETV